MITASFRPWVLRALIPIIATASAWLLVATAAADAATLTLDRACYVYVKHRPVVEVSGTGYGPGDQVSLQSNSGFGLDLTADASGAIAGLAPAPLPPPTVKARRFTVRATDLSPDGADSVVATASSAVAALAASHGAGAHREPGDGALAETVRWAFSGFPAHRRIYGHYLHGGRLVAAQRFGRAKGPCGTLVAHKRGFPGHPHHSSYTVQLDTHRRFSETTTPHLRLKVALSLF